IARHHRLADTQPWLDRPFKRFTAPDAESADVIQEEVRPVLRRKQQNRIRPGRRQFPLYGMVAANKPVDLLSRRLFGPCGNAGGVAAGAGEHDRHVTPLIAFKWSG